jgi:UDP-N-acetylmuramyl pentapeptide phosphotransferase/UDP-N-acetylglucosamine-1-phosphate transferase
MNIGSLYGQENIRYCFVPSVPLCSMLHSLLFWPDDLRHMATTKAGLGQALKFGIGMIIAGFAILNAVRAVKRAARAVKGAGGK